MELKWPIFDIFGILGPFLGQFGHFSSFQLEILDLGPIRGKKKKDFLFFCFEPFWARNGPFLAFSGLFWAISAIFQDFDLKFWI